MIKILLPISNPTVIKMLTNLRKNLLVGDASRFSQFIFEGSGAIVTFNSLPIKSLLLFSTHDSLHKAKQHLSIGVVKK